MLLWTLALRPACAERPLDTEDAAPVGPGRVQAEVSAVYARGPGRTDAGTFVGVVTVGVAPNLDVAAQGTALVLDAPGESVRGGGGDTLLGAKYLLLEETERRPAFLVSPLVRLPTADGPLGLSGVDVQALGVASKTWGAWTTNGNVGYTFATDDRRRDLWTLAASLEWAWTPEWSLAGEVVGDLGTSRDRDRALLRAGGAWAVGEGVILDVAVAGAPVGPLPDVIVTFGATIDLY